MGSASVNRSANTGAVLMKKKEINPSEVRSLGMAVISSCDTCKHVDPRKDPYKCKAFPSGIPPAIFLGYYDHRNRWIEPGSDDNGITYEPREEQKG